MKLSRPFRLIAALIALFSILFAQYAVASYACPALNRGHATEAMAMSADMDNMQAIAGCQGMDNMQPGLCHAHAQVGNQSLDKPELPQVQPFLAIGLALTLIPLDVAFHPVRIQPDALALTRSTAPPLSIRNCCFRI